MISQRGVSAAVVPHRVHILPHRTGATPADAGAAQRCSAKSDSFETENTINGSPHAMIRAGNARTCFFNNQT
jgi:hypothetical protein